MRLGRFLNIIFRSVCIICMGVVYIFKQINLLISFVQNVSSKKKDRGKRILKSIFVVYATFCIDNFCSFRIKHGIVYPHAAYNK